MTVGCLETSTRWVEVERSTTSPRENTERKEVKLDSYYVVIGFEVNNEEAFVDNIHDLAKDYGHAFYYLVKNDEIAKVVSFGPGGAGKTGWFNSQRPTFIKDGYFNSRPGDPDYHVTENVSAFKISLTVKQGLALERVTDSFRADVKAGKERYTAYLNDTCAETARDLLDEAGIDTPSGSGKIKNSAVLSFSLVYAVNPYRWHANFLKNGFVERKFEVAKDTEWIPEVGQADPIFGDQI